MIAEVLEENPPVDTLFIKKILIGEVSPDLNNSFIIKTTRSRAQLQLSTSLNDVQVMMVLTCREV